MFSMRMSVWQQSVLCVTSSVTVACSGRIRLAQHISLKITSKRRFHFTGSAYY